VPELYEHFTKFSKSEVKHFCKLEQQRKPQSQMKPQSLLTTMIANTATPRQYISSISMAVGHQKIGKKIWATSARKKPERL
jgi:hypothetical protein